MPRTLNVYVKSAFDLHHVQVSGCCYHDISLPTPFFFFPHQRKKAETLESVLQTSHRWDRARLSGSCTERLIHIDTWFIPGKIWDVWMFSMCDFVPYLSLYTESGCSREKALGYVLFIPYMTCWQMLNFVEKCWTAVFFHVLNLIESLIDSGWV